MRTARRRPGVGRCRAPSSSARCSGSFASTPLRAPLVGRNSARELLLTFGLVSVVVATPFILAQYDLKRLLGYSSVEHVGIIALGLALVGGWAPTGRCCT